MLHFRMIAIFIFMCCFSACNKNDDVSTFDIIPIISELPTYRMTHAEDGLISEDLFTQEAIIFQSKEQVIDFFTPDFLEKYPEYYSFDFNKYSLIIATTLLSRNVKKRDVYFVFNREALPAKYELRLFYSLENVPKQNFDLEIFGILVNKINLDTINLISVMSI